MYSGSNILEHVKEGRRKRRRKREEKKKAVEEEEKGEKIKEKNSQLDWWK